MKLKKARCQSCGGTLDLQVNRGCEKIFCPFCGQAYEVDSEKQEIIITKKVSVTSRHIDDADVIRAKTEDRKSRLTWLRPVIIAVAVLAVWVGMTYGREITAKFAGKISAGWCLDYHRINHKAAEQYLRELGFVNIVLIDLESSNESYEVEGEVESVTIDGDSNFTDSDYFYPTDKVIIRYY